ncbi:protein PTST, chloroplastic isoform X2 [Arachis ipaensis]|uniref:protein PTST, chloroplastic isoform X2 n=1 Tax=Arachis ipaensis TaxID=130454 RepID=UPI000A2B11A6|nr:protein PTST, chloroplastic isoform X2 [Arachis ipaensis]
MEMNIARCSPKTEGSFFSNTSRTVGWENMQKLPYNNVAVQSPRWTLRKFTSPYRAFTAVCPRRSFFCRTRSMATSLEESSSLQPGENSTEDEDPYAEEELENLAQPLTREQIMALLVDTEREKLTKKLSEANQHNRFLKRQALVQLAKEIAKSGIPEGSRKINGKYIHSHLVTRLEAVHEQLMEQIKDVGAAQSKEVSIFWVGMAESVQVMGTFDGWSQGEHLSPEYTGSYTRFSTTLMLRPGRYEIKFLVDGEWKLSPEFPIIGEGLTKNNLLVVE